MHIKTLTIQGFKSYRDQTQIEPFSAQHNVVVGRNGSGKSNFFAAIRFVLSDAYTSMGREERQALLHEGVSVATTLSAYVEIIFDNSDRRFSTGHDELILRRTIGLKKDEYSLDKKSTSKADVMNLLESAGFSKSNPYYIVPQGRITALTNAKDNERLALLKEVAGTKVYEQRRTESLRIMDETNSKRSNIKELLGYIEGRLTELEEEKEELKEFQNKDKERRCLEYALYQRELEEVGEALVEIEEDRKAEVHGANTRRQKFNEVQKEIQDLEVKISESTHNQSSLTVQREDTQAELTDLVRQRTALECVVNDLDASFEHNGIQSERSNKELFDLEKKIKERERTLSKLQPEWDRAQLDETVEKKALEDAKGILAALFSKQGRMTKFRTKAERDKFLKSEIISLDTYKVSQSEILTTTQGDHASAQDALKQIDTQITAIQEKIKAGKTKTAELNDTIARMKDDLVILTEKRKEEWREDTKSESLVQRASEQLSTTERSLASMMDKDTGAGLRAIDKIAERHNIPGVHGPLYRLFEISDAKFNTAVELTAGNSLFHVVVDTDETASKVLDVMLKEKTGRVTFMPLNRLKPKNPTLPNDPDAIPLLAKLEYDEQYDKAFQQVFGKTCVCRDLTIAAAYVKSHGINTITLDGDKVDRKGALTGGYHDVRRSRIEAVKSVAAFRIKYEEELKKSKDAKASILELDQRITRSQGEITRLQQQQAQIRNLKDSLMKEGYALHSEKERQKLRIAKLEQDVEELQTELHNLDIKLSGYRDELKSPMVQGLTPQEEAQIESLGREVDKRQKDLVEVSKKKNTLDAKKSDVEIELNERLIRRRDELKTRLDGLADDEETEATSADVLATKKRQLVGINASIDNLRKKVHQTDKDLDNLANEAQELQRSLEVVQQQQAEDSRQISRQQKTTERYHAKRQMLLSRKEECNRNIRDLGVLPEEAFGKYTSEKLDRLVKKLHAVNEGLKKFAHVNKKAFEQYNNFTKQRDSLIERRQELDESAQSIEELVEVLDQRKDEAIERTFKQVASNFEEVFEKLVPAGRGRLIIQRRIDLDEDADRDETQETSIENYTGVSIKVSFNSKVDEGLRIQQLSGGQKSLVALATVFAIQKCDPAPFYLFDEIDANLDAQYRTAVASMIHSLCSTAQFITTTFRPEMLVTADKFYGVLFNNQKVSSIRTIKREEAMEFVEQEARAQ